MSRISYILLCHKGPTAIVEQATQLTSKGDYVSIHFDGRAPQQDFDAIRKGLQDNPNVTFARKRIKCGWGEWSLIQATLNAVRAAFEAFPEATHFYMISGDCLAIKTAEYAHRFLDAHDVDYIESFDFFQSGWIQTGLIEERLIYRHYFNERKHKRLFYWSFWAQRWLGWSRKIPEDIEVMIGSQWWCLRRSTIELILKFIAKRRDVMRFFSTTWIPDETFFQTLVRHLVPEQEINPRTLTFLMFTDYGMPVTFYNDHFDLLLVQDFLFARKISPDAKQLKTRLGQVYSETGRQFQISNEGRPLHKFLTKRGRMGRRFGQRFWESESNLGRERELLMVTCKKWHVAKRLTHSITRETKITSLPFIFNELGGDMPDLGGIANTLDKRMRHRRSLLRMLFDYYETDRMVLCVEPSNLEIMTDFYNDKSTTKLLELHCTFSDEYLAGHAHRIGLASNATPPSVMDGLLLTVRRDIMNEHNQILDSDFPDYFLIDERKSVEKHTSALASFLDIDQDTAQRIAETQHLFAD